MNKYLTTPNLITAGRIAGSLCLLVPPPLSPGFFIIYTLCGVSDVLDGLVARVTHSASEFGARLDSIADLVFYPVSLLRLLPYLRRLPNWVWSLLWLTLGLRLCSYLAAAVRYRRFASLHTYLNKLTGLAVFLIPYLLGTPAGAAVCAAACIIGALASLEELLIHLRDPVYCPGRKSIFQSVRPVALPRTVRRRQTPGPRKEA